MNLHILQTPAKKIARFFRKNSILCLNAEVFHHGAEEFIHFLFLFQFFHLNEIASQAFNGISFFHPRSFGRSGHLSCCNAEVILTF